MRFPRYVLTGRRVSLDRSMHAVTRVFLAWLGAVVCAGCGASKTDEVDEPLPFEVRSDLFDPVQPDTLGLVFAPGVQTFTIFRPGDGDNAFNHGVVLLPFKGRLFAQWQTSARDEDAPDTHVVYSISDDGEDWAPPMALAPAWDSGIRTSGGWWSDGDTLVAYINVWPRPGDGPVQGVTHYMTSEDGIEWSEPQPVLDADGVPVAGIFEQDPHALPDGRIISAFHEQPGLHARPWYTDDPLGVGGWMRGAMTNLPFPGDTSRELEPGWYRRDDGAVVMVFRDQGDSFRKLASVSTDRGATWTTPVVTDMPDSRSKQSAGNLPDGTAFQVNNPSGNRRRVPLVIVTSVDGRVFDSAWLLRSGGADLQPLRTPGKYKRKGYSYPKSVVWGDYLYVAYATNKEDVELTRVPLVSLPQRH